METALPVRTDEAGRQRPPQRWVTLILTKR
jgi:hypothetical protein